MTHLILWTILPTLTSPNAPLDVIEGYAWGREWLIGTYKHPPMQAWWLQILAILTDRASWVHFLASQIAIVVAFWAVWQTGRQILDDKAALLSVLLLEGVVYYNFTSVEFNPNVLQLPFWALTSLSFYRAVKNNHMGDWALLGLWSAGGMYSKYSTALLLLTLATFMFFQPLARRRLAGIGPYLAVSLTVILFLPHIFWLFHNNFLPFKYAIDRLQPLSVPHIVPNFIFSPLILLCGQFIALLPLALLFLVFYGRSEKIRHGSRSTFDRDFLRAVTFGPFILTFVLSIIIGFKIHDMWGVPFWNFLGLWLVARFHPSFAPESLTRFFYAWITICAATLVLFLGSNILTPYVDFKSKRVQFPGQALANYVTDAWHQRYHAPLRFVIGDTWPAGNVGYYAPERPHVFILGDKLISPWIKLHDLEEYGGVIVWCVRHCLNPQEQFDDIPDFVRDKFPRAEVQPPFSLARQTEADIPPVKMGWAILPPVTEKQ